MTIHNWEKTEGTDQHHSNRRSQPTLLMSCDDLMTHIILPWPFPIMFWGKQFQVSLHTKCSYNKVLLTITGLANHMNKTRILAFIILLNNDIHDDWKSLCLQFGWMLHSDAQHKIPLLYQYSVHLSLPWWRIVNSQVFGFWVRNIVSWLLTVQLMDESG